jgi:hypothetical protein
MKRLLRLLLVMGMVGCEGRLQRPPRVMYAVRADRCALKAPMGFGACHQARNTPENARKFPRPASAIRFVASPHEL